MHHSIRTHHAIFADDGPSHRLEEVLTASVEIPLTYAIWMTYMQTFSSMSDFSARNGRVRSAEVAGDALLRFEILGWIFAPAYLIYGRV